MVATANDRCEFEVRIGNQTRLLTFRREQAAKFGQMLGKDPLKYISDGGEMGFFSAHAIIAGLSGDRKAVREVTPTTVYRWLDDAEEWNDEEFAKQVLYAIARGKRGEEAERMVRVLDEVFADAPRRSDDKGNTSPGPSNAG